MPAELTTTRSDFTLDCFTKELLWTKGTFQQVGFMDEKRGKPEMSLLSETIFPPSFQWLVIFLSIIIIYYIIINMFLMDLLMEHSSRSL